MNAFTADHFQSHELARAWLERLRWPEGPVCPYCGTIGHAYKTSRTGYYRCAESKCRKDFTVTMGTVMERSHIPLHKWLMAFYLMASSKKGISAHQFHRSLRLDYKSAWFMAHRIREAMASDDFRPMGGGGQIVEADETYYGRTSDRQTKTKGGRPLKKASASVNKRPILALVERGRSVRTFHVPVADKATVQKIVKENIARESRLHTDESKLYGKLDQHFAEHGTVKHSAGEYERDGVHTNTAEGYFSVFKRGMRGIYQHCDEKHLHRYLAEYDFRFNHRVALGIGDTARTLAAIRGAEGKRLLYRQPD